MCAHNILIITTILITVCYKGCVGADLSETWYVPEIFEVSAPVQSNMKEKRLFIFPIIRIFFENHVQENC